MNMRRTLIIILRGRDDRMIEQFKLALLRGVEPGVVEKELKDRLHREVKQREQAIEADRKRAEFIALGMREPEGSEPRAIADSYLKQYEQDTGEKISAHRDGDIARALKGDDSE